MSDESNNYVFCADYSAMAACLLGIQVQQAAGLYHADQTLLGMLNTFENDLLKKLYSRTLRIYAILGGAVEGEIFVPGDFDKLDFSEIDFATGYFDTPDGGIGSRFQTIVNVFAMLCSRENEISNADKNGIAAAFFPVADAFQELITYLKYAGFDPCNSLLRQPAYFNNSPELHLHVAGSDGSNNLPQGVFLRWSLNGELGDNHIPRGDYPNGQPVGHFNRRNDYVFVSRAAYNPFIFEFDFSTLIPIINYAKREWTYLQNQSLNGKVYSNVIRLAFTDEDVYRTRVLQVDPATAPYTFLQGYAGRLEIVFTDKTAFSFGVKLQNHGTASSAVKIEALTLPDDGTTDEMPCLRNTLTVTQGAVLSRTYHADNIRRVKMLQDGNTSLQSFAIETYNDFLKSTPDEAWVPVGSGFALSLDDQTVFDRLESAGENIDHRWPQYADGLSVKTSNYQQKWLNADGDAPSLKSAVNDYLDRSQTDSRAEVSLQDTNADPSTPPMTMSYIDILNLQASDFHVARMLGLGHIDSGVELLTGNRFIYKIQYVNQSTANGPVVNFAFLSLPISLTEARLPEKPVMRSIAYSSSSAAGASFGSFDANGYDNTRHVRLVNIGRIPIAEEISEDDFFSGAVQGAEFNLGANARSVLYDISYRPATQSYYRLPAITATRETGTVYYAYNDNANYPGNMAETVPVYDNEQSLFMHLEQQDGVHYYAIRGIDIFSRPSLLSDPESTDETNFPPINQLKPPANINSVYVQLEDPVVFTTPQEQIWIQARLNAFPDADINFTRVVFNWVDVADVTFISDTTTSELAKVVKANQINTYFRSNTPLQLSGVVQTVIATGPNQYAILAGSYKLLDGITQITPTLDPASYSKFAGSSLITADGKLFNVVTVTTIKLGSNNELAFIVDAASSRVAIDGDHAISTMSTYAAPQRGLRFTVAENLAGGGNWLPVQAKVQVVDFSDMNSPVIESQTDPYGNVSKQWVGGIHGDAIVVPAIDTESGQPVPGYYYVTFAAGTTLDPHPQSGSGFAAGADPASLHDPYVEWYNGQVYLPLFGSNDKKLVTVVRIKGTSPVDLVVYDPSYDVAPFRLSATPGSFISANFHPGYRVYYYPEPAPNTFNGSNILPAEGASNKKSMLALQSADIRDTGTFLSAMSLPSAFITFYIQMPQQPDDLIATQLKVRPDATGKAALTFDIKITEGRKPYGWMLYRAQNETVLKALYQPATVTAILAALAPLVDQPDFGNHYLDLLNVKFDINNLGHFAPYGGYALPLPDLPGIALDANGQPLTPGSAQLIANYKSAIHTTLMPLTQQPPVLAYIKEGQQTENTPPAIRTTDGGVLGPNDPGFNPFPMTRKYSKNEPGIMYVRFTDYTLNGSSRFLYFYSAAETTDKMQQGLLSKFLGPVTVLHTQPGDAPIIRTHAYGLNPVEGQAPISVTFNLTPFASYDPITKVRIFRTMNPADTQQLGTMTSFIDVDLPSGTDPDAAPGITVSDLFPDAATFPIPFGETIYYRLAFVRTIMNEQDLPEEVVSLGSKVATITLVDIINPVAPDLQYVNNALVWSPAANKGTYYLYQQNTKGNWQLIYSVVNTDNQDMSFPVELPTQDENGNSIYSRFKVRVQNASGLFNLVDQEFTTTNPATILISPASLRGITKNVPVAIQLSVSGGTAPYAFTLADGDTLPMGLTLHADTGIIDGQATVAGSNTFKIIATDSDQRSGHRVYTLNTVPPTISLSPASLGDLAVGVAVNQQFSASGGAAPYTYAVSEGALPDGLLLSSTGLLSGTPAGSGGAFAVTITATDQNGDIGSLSYQLQVAPPDPITLPPVLTGAETNYAGDRVTLAFNLSMSTPSGQETYFSITETVSESPVNKSVLSVKLHPTDNTKIQIVFSQAVAASGNALTISYNGTSGNIQSTYGQKLGNISGQAVVNRYLDPLLLSKKMQINLGTTANPGGLSGWNDFNLNNATNNIVIAVNDVGGTSTGYNFTMVEHYPDSHLQGTIDISDNTYNNIAASDPINAQFPVVVRATNAVASASGDFSLTFALLKADNNKIYNIMTTGWEYGGSEDAVMALKSLDGSVYDSFYPSLNIADYARITNQKATGTALTATSANPEADGYNSNKVIFKCTTVAGTKTATCGFIIEECMDN